MHLDIVLEIRAHRLGLSAPSRWARCIGVLKVCSSSYEMNHEQRRSQTRDYPLAEVAAIGKRWQRPTMDQKFQRCQCV